MINYKLLIQQLDHKIRTGLHREAQAQLFEFLRPSPHIPRDYVADIAALARRLSLSDISIKLLRPYVRPSERKFIVASPVEISEYAAALIRLDVVNEAHYLLNQVNPTEYPRSLLFKAFAYISKWDYEKSNLHLLQLVHGNYSMDPYEILIAKVNIAMGLVFLERTEEAQTLLIELEKETREQNLQLLRANTLEMLSDNASQQKNWKQAEEYLNEGLGLLKSSDVIDAFLLQKQRAINNLKQYNNSPHYLKQLKKIKLEAENKKQWESVRDCDFYLSTIGNHNKNIKTRLNEIDHLYYGTPYPLYQTKIVNSLKKYSLQPSPNYIWTLGKGKTKPIIIDRLSGENSSSSNYLKNEQVPYKLFQSLTEDFYRPKRLKNLYDAIYPNEYYEPVSSPDKIYQAMQRLRYFFQISKIPLTINESNGFFKINAKSGYTVNITNYTNQLSTSPTKQDDLKLWRLLVLLNESYRESFFSAKMFSTHLQLAERTGLRYLKKSIDLKWVERSGQGPKSVYSFTKNFFQQNHSN